MEQHQQRGAKERLSSCWRCVREDFCCDLHLLVLVDHSPCRHDPRAFRPLAQRRVRPDFQHLEAKWVRAYPPLQVRLVHSSCSRGYQARYETFEHFLLLPHISLSAYQPPRHRSAYTATFALLHEPDHALSLTWKTQMSCIPSTWAHPTLVRSSCTNSERVALIAQWLKQQSSITTSQDALECESKHIQCARNMSLDTDYVLEWVFHYIYFTTTTE